MLPQSYEFALIAGPTLGLIQRHPRVEVVGSYHDGNVLVIPTAERDQILEQLRESVTDLGKRLGLGFPIDLELQEVFDPIKR